VQGTSLPNANPVAGRGDGYAGTGLPTGDCALASVTTHSRSEKKSNVTRVPATAPTLNPAGSVTRRSSTGPAPAQSASRTTELGDGATADEQMTRQTVEPHRLLGDESVSTIVVEHRDRFARFGAEYVEAHCRPGGAGYWWRPRPGWMTTWCGM
jgi:hypothetical protein